MSRVLVCAATALLMLLVWGFLWSAEQVEFTAEQGPDGIQHVDILAGSYFFRPNYIVARAGSPVDLSIRKERGLTPHDFVIQATDNGMDMKMELSEEPKTLRFTPVKPGTFHFYCSKKLPFSESHRQKGMEGVLEIKE